VVANLPKKAEIVTGPIDKFLAPRTGENLKVFEQEPYEEKKYAQRTLTTSNVLGLKKLDSVAPDPRQAYFEQI